MSKHIITLSEVIERANNGVTTLRTSRQRNYTRSRKEI